MLCTTPCSMLPNILTICNFNQIYCTLQLVLLLPNILTICNLKQICCTLELVLLLPNVLTICNFKQIFLHACLGLAIPPTSHPRVEVSPRQIEMNENETRHDGWFYQDDTNSCNLHEMLSKTQMRPGTIPARDLFSLAPIWRVAVFSGHVICMGVGQTCYMTLKTFKLNRYDDLK